MNNAIPLHNWSCTSRTPSGKVCLQGTIEPGVHPKHPNGGQIRTSTVVESSGRIVNTYSGSIYKLEEPDPNYLKWLDEHGYRYDENDPIGWGKGSRRKT